MIVHLCFYCSKALVGRLYRNGLVFFSIEVEPLYETFLSAFFFPSSFSWKKMAGRPSSVTQLLPYLYLGGELDAASRDRLIEHNITAILNCAYPQASNHFVSDVNCFSYFSVS